MFVLIFYSVFVIDAGYISGMRDGYVLGWRHGNKDICPNTDTYLPLIGSCSVNYQFRTITVNTIELNTTSRKKKGI